MQQTDFISKILRIFVYLIFAIIVVYICVTMKWHYPVNFMNILAAVGEADGAITLLLPGIPFICSQYWAHRNIVYLLVAYIQKSC